jgi:hypothetical protein
MVDVAHPVREQDAKVVAEGHSTIAETVEEIRCLHDRWEKSENYKKWLEAQSAEEREKYGPPEMYRRDLQGANLLHANLRGAKLSPLFLGGKDLNLAGASDLRGANLTGADLRGARLRGAKLQGADLENAKLTEADLCYANLQGDSNADRSGVCERANADPRHAHGPKALSESGSHQVRADLQDPRAGCSRALSALHSPPHTFVDSRRLYGTASISRL